MKMERSKKSKVFLDGKDATDQIKKSSYKVFIGGEELTKESIMEEISKVINYIDTFHPMFKSNGKPVRDLIMFQKLSEEIEWDGTEDAQREAIHKKLNSQWISDLTREEVDAVDYIEGLLQVRDSEFIDKYIDRSDPDQPIFISNGQGLREYYASFNSDGSCIWPYSQSIDEIAAAELLEYWLPKDEVQYLDLGTMGKIPYRSTDKDPLSLAFAVIEKLCDVASKTQGMEKQGVQAFEAMDSIKQHILYSSLREIPALRRLSAESLAISPKDWKEIYMGQSNPRIMSIFPGPSVEVTLQNFPDALMKARKSMASSMDLSKMIGVPKECFPNHKTNDLQTQVVYGWLNRHNDGMPKDMADIVILTSEGKEGCHWFPANDPDNPDLVGWAIRTSGIKIGWNAWRSNNSEFVYYQIIEKL